MDTRRREFVSPSGGAHVVDSSMFRLLVDLEVQKAQRLHYSISLLCLAADLPAHERGDSAAVLTANVLFRSLRATDAIAPCAQSSLAILLIDAETAHLPPIIDRLTEQLQPVAWSAGGSCYPRSVTRADDMLRQAVDLMIRARQTPGNHLLLPT